MRNYYIKTFGCQMNMADSDAISACFLARGMMPVEDLHDADVVVVNTCAVRQQAENRAFSYIGRLKPYKKSKPELVVIFAGCIAERLGNKLKTRFPIIDLVAGAKNIDCFPQAFDRLMEQRNAGAAEVLQAKAGASYAGKTIFPASSFVTIMRGCENFCSYCIVPYVRGAEQSRPSTDILEEIRRQVAGGAREVTLLGQNVNSYRDKSVDFPELLRLVNGVPGLLRIRFMTSHPKDLSSRLITAMQELPKVCEHLHLPLQSGSDRILKAMNRQYTWDEYLERVERVRAAVPGVSITTDILVGFPGETAEDFNATLAAVHTAGFDSLYAFKYSPRPGTAAAGLEDDVPDQAKEERLAAVLAAADGIFARKNATIPSTVHEVLVEDKRGEIFVGRTRACQKVYFAAGDAQPGALVSVTITGVKANSLLGAITP